MWDWNHWKKYVNAICYSKYANLYFFLQFIGIFICWRLLCLWYLWSVWYLIHGTRENFDWYQKSQEITEWWYHQQKRWWWNQRIKNWMENNMLHLIFKIWLDISSEWRVVLVKAISREMFWRNGPPELDNI